MIDIAIFILFAASLLVALLMTIPLREGLVMFSRLVRPLAASVLVALALAPIPALGNEDAAPASVLDDGNFEYGPYFGAGAAHVTIRDYCGPLGIALSVRGYSLTSCEDTAVGFKIFGRYRATEFFGLEGGYASAEGFEFKVPDVSVEPKLSTFFVAGTWLLPMSESLSLTGKLGWHFWELNLTGCGSGGCVSANDVDSDDDLMFGFGAEFQAADNILIQGEWSRFFVELDDVDAFSASVAAIF